AARRSVLRVNQRDLAAEHGPKADFGSPQAVVRILEVGVEVRAETAHRIQHVAAHVGHCKYDALDLAIATILPEILLQSPDLLSPQRVGEDVSPGVEQAAVREG